FQPAIGYGYGYCNVFVTKLNAAGSALVYSTYLGGKGNDSGNGIAVDAAGEAVVAGYTQSTNFPTANALQKEGGEWNNGHAAPSGNRCSKTVGSCDECAGVGCWRNGYARARTALAAFSPRLGSLNLQNRSAV
ncbi:MAG TPA: SBBP repeat-containing protein, partial [Pirellulales bacterium]|nr:SBBP repeat-containing protein [Pirellulales bacterium]